MMKIQRLKKREKGDSRQKGKHTHSHSHEGGAGATESEAESIHTAVTAKTERRERENSPQGGAKDGKKRAEDCREGGKQVSHPHIIIFQKCSKTWQAATDI